MSSVEVEELSALGEWISSFPQIEQFASDEENSSLFDEKECGLSSDLRR